MKRILRYLSVNYLWTTVSFSFCSALVSTAGSQWLGIRFLDTYYMMLPIMISIFLAIYAATLSTLYRQTALSMNCRRKDFFLGMQVVFLLSALICAAITLAAGRLPELFHIGYVDFGNAPFESARRTGAPMFASFSSLPWLIAGYWLLQPLGAVLGLLTLRRKVLGILLTAILLLLSVVGVVLGLFVADGTIVLTTLPVLIFFLVLAGASLSCQFYLYRSNARATI